MVLGLSLFRCRWCPYRRACHVLLSGMCKRRVLHEHRVVPLWRMRMAHWRWWAVEHVLWVIRRLRVDDTGVEIRVLRIVGMQRRCTVGRRGGIHWDSIHGRYRSAACVWRRWCHAVDRCVIWRAWHWSAGHSWYCLGLVDRRLRVHVLWWPDVSQLNIVCWLGQIVRVRSRVVADKVQVLAALGGDAERLLHETVGLVSVAVRALPVRLASR
jgi:hypothetical protein